MVSVAVVTLLHISCMPALLPYSESVLLAVLFLLMLPSLELLPPRNGSGSLRCLSSHTATCTTPSGTCRGSCAGVEDGRGHMVSGVAVLACLAASSFLLPGLSWLQTKVGHEEAAPPSPHALDLLFAAAVTLRLLYASGQAQAALAPQPLPQQDALRDIISEVRTPALPFDLAGLRGSGCRVR